MPKSFSANMITASLSISFVSQALEYLTRTWEAVFIPRCLFRILVGTFCIIGWGQTSTVSKASTFPHHHRQYQRVKARLGLIRANVWPMWSNNLMNPSFVEFNDLINGGHGEHRADLIVVANGANSIARRLVLPTSQIKHHYSGYVAWWGTVAERKISEETNHLFGCGTGAILTPGGYILV